MKFRGLMILLAILNFVLANIIESIVVDKLISIRFEGWYEKFKPISYAEHVFNDTRTVSWLPGQQGMDIKPQNITDQNGTN